jgi:hypothetical protein
MRTTITLLALVLAEVFPSLAHAEPTTTQASVASHGGDLSGRLGYESGGRFSPSVTVELRAAAGHDEALLGPVETFYRAQPELLFGLRPIAHLAVFAGGGVGAAYLVPDAGEHGTAARPTVTLSGVLGARFPWERVPVTAVTRAESVRGGGTAVTLSLALALADVAR